MVSSLTSSPMDGIGPLGPLVESSQRKRKRRWFADRPDAGRLRRSSRLGARKEREEFSHVQTNVASSRNIMRSIATPHMCEICQIVWQNMWATHGEQRKMPQTLQELQDSAQRGCHMCSLRWDHLTAEERIQLRGSNSLFWTFWRGHVEFKYHDADMLPLKIIELALEPESGGQQLSILALKG